MLCPICHDPLVILEIEHVEVDVCVNKHGLWFDAQELGQLFELAGVPEQCQGLERRLAKLKHAGKKRRCPRCNAVMTAVHAPEDPSLILDECPKDDGLWFDVGELEALLRCILDDGADEPLRRVRAYLGDCAAPAEEERRSGRADEGNATS